MLGPGGAPVAAAIREMLARNLCSLTGEPDERAAWGSLLSGLRPGHVVGIKLNTVALHLVPHREVVDALVDSLTEIGVQPRNVVVWDNLGRLGPVRMRFYGNLERPEGAYYQAPEGSASMCATRCGRSATAGRGASRSSSPGVSCSPPIPWRSMPTCSR